jgi:hypothetical protein
MPEKSLDYQPPKELVSPPAVSVRTVTTPDDIGGGGDAVAPQSGRRSLLS